MLSVQRRILTLFVASAAALAFSPAWAGAVGWTEDFTAAQAEAASTDRDLLIDFTGSDWCAPCIILDREVFSTSAFRAGASNDFVLVKLDYPRTFAQDPSIVQQNEALRLKYQVEIFPTILLADAEGRPYAQTSYLPGGPQNYLAHLGELKAQRVARDAALAQAEDAKGLDKARALDEAMQAVGLDLAIIHYPSEVELIIALDAENEAGLKETYHPALSMARIESDVDEALELLQSGQMQAGLERLDRVIEERQPENDTLQLITAIKGQVHYRMGEKDHALALLRQAVDFAPDSDIAPQLEAMIGQLN